MGINDPGLKSGLLAQGGSVKTMIQQFLALLTHDGGCRVCEQLAELYEATPQTNRHYWLMTELFVKLHGGDVCSASRVKEGVSATSIREAPSARRILGFIECGLEVFRWH